MTVIGMDVGTTGTKAIVVDENGKVLGQGYGEYELIALGGGAIEQRAEDWWNAGVKAVHEAIRGLDVHDIVGLSISTQGGTMLPVDKNFHPMRDALTWMDSRSKAECAELKQAAGEENIYHKTGWGAYPGNDASKTIWIRKHEPEIFEQAASFVSTLEYMNYKLTGHNVIDPTNGAMRGMIDIQTMKWDPEILKAVGITEDRLPKILPTGAFIGTLTKQAAEELGIPESIKVYNGAHDQYCAAIGCGALEPGDMFLSTGTTWVVLGVTDHAVYSPTRIAPGVHTAGCYGVMASMKSAGSSLKWLKNTLCIDSYRTLDEEAEKRMYSAEGILYYPFMAGSGFPHRMDSLFSGAIGLQLHHDRYDLARALMEGVAFEARTIIDEFKRTGVPVTTLKMMGGASKSKLWSEITGYATGCRILCMKESETCALGAAIIASVNAGISASYKDACTRFVQCEELVLDDPVKKEFYENKYQKYGTLLNAIKGVVKQW